MFANKFQTSGISPRQREQYLLAIVPSHKIGNSIHGGDICRGTNERVVSLIKSKMTNLSRTKKSEKILRLKGGELVDVADQYDVTTSNFPLSHRRCQNDL